MGNRRHQLEEAFAPGGRRRLLAERLASLLLLASAAGNWWLFSAARPHTPNYLALTISLINVGLVLFSLHRAVITKSTSHFIISLFGGLVSAVLEPFSLIYFDLGKQGFGVRLSHLDAFYVATGFMTTAGSGSLSPLSQGARAFAIAQMLIDASLVAAGGTLLVAGLRKHLVTNP